MVDDGMLLNFEIGGDAFKPQIKFKGGRWRDRVRAQKSAKRGLDGGSTRGNEAGDGRTDAQRPAKRQRIGEGDGDAERRQQQGPSAGARSQHTRSQHVTSRLFSANPMAVTNFDEKPTPDEPTQPVQPSNAPLSDEAATFHALGLSRRIALHLSSKLEMKAPTSIQRNTVPQLIKDDSDAFLQAQTGSGKTLAYLLPIVSRILALSESQDGSVDKQKHKKINRNSGLFAIILAPTRELCKQIATVLEKLLRCTPWIVGTTVIGGESKHKEKARLRKGVNILIATPGRLTDHLDHSKMLDVGTVRWLVLDEGDRLMEMGFEEDLRTIVGKIRKEPLREENKDGVVLGTGLPKRRVTVLCSATMKMNVQKLGEISLVDAVHITAAATRDGEGETAEGNETNDVVFTAPSQLKQSYLVVPAKLRLVTLIALLKSSFARKGSVMKAIVFISCADSVDFHFSLLRQPPELPTANLAGDAEASPKRPPATSHTETTVARACYISSPANPSITLHRLHGSLSQPVRTATLQAFTTAKDPAVLITTDISSRGLDVPAVDLVIEYDPSFSVADHVHRIGRTARAGRPGKAMLFLQPGCEEGYIGGGGRGSDDEGGNGVDEDALRRMKMKMKMVGSGASEFNIG
ncbi:ATP-dependent RNA helicase DBP7 [Magnaporthiopsis poae ATCC 64411]|uniref:ATP-dependent RNA helicase n=1 Tax=Magnaporthiopsis poae (strain ATCC 64411 / 73-15) TaxID=644358 RepID=A0A0C4DNR0_MAGP6|nr:ATP-dependent RNA helicase DBP7 [Magnaporthiopsis poae ATCC 64411]